MCDFSLHNVKSRPATVGDKLTTHNFITGTCGFAAPENSTPTVCIVPGTELAFSAEVICASSRLFGWRTISSRTAIFRQIDKDVPRVHHDALEFPDGTLVLLTDLHEGQQATVLQLPAQPKTLAKQRPRRASCASANIRRITRLPPEPWWCRRLRVPRTPSLLIKRPNRLTSAVMIAHLHWHKSGAPAAGRVS